MYLLRIDAGGVKDRNSDSLTRMNSISSPFPIDLNVPINWNWLCTAKIYFQRITTYWKVKKTTVNWARSVQEANRDTETKISVMPDHSVPDHSRLSRSAPVDELFRVDRNQRKYELSRNGKQHTIQCPDRMTVVLDWTRVERNEPKNMLVIDRMVSRD